MIEQSYSDHFPCSLQPLCDFDVLGGWIEAARGMIVRYNYCTCSIDDWVSEDFTGMNDRAIDQADGDHPDGEQLVGSIQGSTDKALLLSVSPV